MPAKVTRDFESDCHREKMKGKTRELLAPMNMVMLCQVSSNSYPISESSHHTGTTVLDVTILVLTVFLGPMDLLNLSRITKACRSSLVRRSSAFIWWKLVEVTDCKLP